MHNIYDMLLHQVITINMDYIGSSGYHGEPIEVMRVPGGWLYNVHTEHQVFVPYSRQYEK